MGNHHYEKWFLKMPIGFLLIACGIFFMYYTITHFFAKNWIAYASISAVAIATGAVLLSSAAVNKIKSDLIKKQKIKQQSG